MQVFGLPRHVIRTGSLASRIAAKSSSNEAAIRRELVVRWRGAMARGLTARQAAEAVGASRASLYRWQRSPELRSRRPHEVRRPAWTSSLVQAVEDLRLDNPMWGKRKLAVLLRREGFAVSVSTVGRILTQLVKRGVVVPVPTLRRKPGGRRFRLNPAQRYARRLPKGLKANRPGALVQIDTLSVNVAPGKAIKHVTAYDPVAKNAPRAPGDTSSTPATTCPAASTSCSPSSTPSPTASTTTDPTTHSTAGHPPSISKPSANETSPRLRCPEPGHALEMDGAKR